MSMKTYNKIIEIQIYNESIPVNSKWMGNFYTFTLFRARAEATYKKIQQALEIRPWAHLCQDVLT